MNLKELSGLLPESLRHQIEANESLSVWLKMGYTLEQIWSDPVIVQSIWSSMSRFEQTAARVIITKLGSLPFDWAKMEESCKHILTGAQAKVGFVQLLRKGFAFTMRKSWGEHQYVMAAETADALRLAALTPYKQSQKINSAESIPESMATWDGLGGDLFTLLVYIGKQEVKLTQKGALHKKHIQKLREAFRVPENCLQKAGIAFTFGDLYDSRLAVTLDIALQLALIEVHDDRYVLNTDGIRNWLARTTKELNVQLYAWWKRRCAAMTALQQLVTFAMEQSGNTLVTKDGIRSWLELNDIAVSEDQFEEEWCDWLARWVEPCAAFEWLKQEDDGAIRWSLGLLPDNDDSDHAEEHKLFVQPDFEIIVPPTASPYTRWELECIASAVRYDRVAVYKLTPESVCFALENGRTAEQLLQFLESRSMYEVADHVKSAVLQWGNQFGQMVIGQVALLRCRDLNTADELETGEQFRSYWTEKLGDKDFIVKEEQVPELVRKLGAAGFSARWLPASSNRREGSGAAGKPPFVQIEQASDHPIPVKDTTGLEGNDLGGLVLKEHKIQSLSIEANLPELKDLFPKLQEVPSMWMKDYRSYHNSTRKQVVEKAIEWKTALQIRKDGCDCVFIPERLQESRGDWFMWGRDTSGQGDIVLSPGEWDEMRLIVPGVNDK
jgi:hypothetical protein